MPETIGLLLLTAIGEADIAATAVIGSLTTAQIVGNLALAGAAIGLNYALTSKPETKPQDGQLTVRQPLPSRRRNYGLVKIGGPLMFSEVSGPHRYQVVALNQGELNAIVEHWLDDAGAVIGLDGAVSVRYSLPGVPYVFLYFALGTDSDAALPVLTAAFPSLWTSAHQGKGIAKFLIVTTQPDSKDFTTVYPGAQPPVYRAVAQSSKVWDPRDGAQDQNDKSTWLYSENPVLIALDFHRHKDGMGLNVFDSVFFTTAAITDDWIPAADICDEVMTSADLTTHPRYGCSGGYDLNQAPKDVLSQILSTCDGQTFQRPDGAIGIRVGKTIAPTITISDRHILGYDGFRNGPPNSLIAVNEVTAKYTDRDFDYQEVDADKWLDAAAISAAGREETRDLQLQWVPLHAQARRLMKLAFHRFNPQWSGRIITTLDGVRAYSERYITLEITELGINGTFEVTSFELTPGSMTCSIGVSALDQSAFDWNAALEEGTRPPVPDITPTDGSTPETPTSVLGVASSHVITITWDAPFNVLNIPEAQYSVQGSGVWSDATILSNVSAETPTLANGTYDVRVRFTILSTSSAYVSFTGIVVS